MSFNKYYQDELSFLREMGREFAQAYPEAAHFLAEKGSDPDVERLLEGFAFLTGRIRQKLDDELPEVTHALMSLLLPHYLRPVPAASIVEFLPIRGMVEKPHRVPRGTEVASVPVDGTPCRFRTCFDVDLAPIAVDSAEIHTPAGGRPELRLRFGLDPRHSAAGLGLSTLRLFLSGDSADLLYLWLRRHVERVRVRPASGSAGADAWLGPEAIRPAGFDRDTALLPYGRASLDGYRLLQEYFLFPEKFLFVDLGPLDGVRDRLGSGGFEVAVVFAPDGRPAPKVGPGDVRLFCTPVVNLFPLESEPLSVDHARAEYRVRPAGGHAGHFEIHSIDRVSGWTRGTVEERVYPPLYSFRSAGQSRPEPEEGDLTCYHARLQQAVTGEGTETYLSFVHPDRRQAVPPTETVVCQLTCTNRGIAARLRAGDIHVATDSSPAVARFTNVTRVSPGAAVPLGGDLHWRLISHLALNTLALSSAETLRETLQLYNFDSGEHSQAARANRLRLEGIAGVESRPDTVLLGAAPVRGMTTRVRLKESHFRSEGDLYLFGAVLDEFLSLCVSLNAFSRLIVVGAEKGETYEWPARLGRQLIL